MQLIDECHYDSIGKLEKAMVRQCGMSFNP